MNQLEPRSKRDLKPKPPKWNSPIGTCRHVVALWSCKARFLNSPIKTIPIVNLRTTGP